MAVIIVAILRVSGYAERVSIRNWSKPDGRSGAIHSVVVRVNDFIATDVTLSRSLENNIAEGDYVDLIVDVSVSGPYLRINAQAPWPVEVPVHADLVA